MNIENLNISKYNYTLSQVFSPSWLKRISDPNFEEEIKFIVRQCNLYSDWEAWDITKGFETVYDYLMYNYRCEYIYKNEIANQILLRYHKNNSATLLKEVMSYNSIADIVIINGNTVAYEIKSELDSFDRLEGQMKAYQMLYDSLYVVTYSGALDVLTPKLDPEIGIIILDEKGKLKTVRKAAVSTVRFSPEKAVLTLRQSELLKAYEKHEGKFPKMGTALVFNFCINWYSQLDKEKAHRIFRESLKSRKPCSDQFKLVQKCHPSLRMLFLGRDLSKKYCRSVTNILGIFVE